MAHLTITFKRILPGIYLPKKVKFHTEENGYDWCKLPLDLKIADLIFHLSIPGYEGEAVKSIYGENAPSIEGD